MKEELNVVAALIRKDDKILLCQRNRDDNYANLWEFPGGVPESGESFHAAIEREIEEELGFGVKAQQLIADFFDENDNLKIKVFLFSCLAQKGVPKTLDCQDFGFFTILQAQDLNLAPVDKQILHYLKNSDV